MSTDNFDSHLKKTLNKLLKEKNWFFYKDITKNKWSTPFKLSYREKLTGVDARYNFQTDLTLKEFTSIYDRKPNWVIDISPTTVFSYVVDNIQPQHISKLFKNYAHFTTFKNCFSTLCKREDKKLAKIFFTTAYDILHSASGERTIEEEKQVLKQAKKLFTEDEFYDALHGYLSNNIIQYSSFYNAQALQFILKEFVTQNFTPKEVDTFKKYYPKVNQNNLNLEEEIFLDISHKSLSIYVDQKAFYNKIEIPDCKPEKLPGIYSSIMSTLILYLKTQMQHLGILDCSQVIIDMGGVPHKQDIVHLLITHDNDKYLTDKQIKQFLLKAAVQLGQNFEILKDEDKKQQLLNNFLKIEFNDKLDNILISKEITSKPLKI